MNISESHVSREEQAREEAAIKDRQSPPPGMPGLGKSFLLKERESEQSRICPFYIDGETGEKQYNP